MSNMDGPRDAYTKSDRERQIQRTALVCGI